MPYRSAKPAGSPLPQNKSTVLIHQRDLAHLDPETLEHVVTLIIVRPEPIEAEVSETDRMKEQLHPRHEKLPLALQVDSGKFSAAHIASMNEHHLEILAPFCQGRHVTEVRLDGVPNSHSRVARLSWSSLANMPQSGTVYAPREDLLVRAASWLALSTGQLGQLPANIDIRLPFAPAEVPKEEAVQEFYKQCKHQPKEQAQLRCWLDVMYTYPQPTVSELGFALKEDMEVTYISQ